MLWLAVGLLVPLALAARLAAGRWLRPGALFAGFWAIAGIVPLLMLPGARVTAQVVIYIAVAVAVFTIGAVLSGKTPDNTPAMKGSIVNPKALHRACIAGLLAGLGAALLALRSHGFSADSVLSFADLLDVGNAVSVQRYTRRASPPPGVPILLGVTYAAAVVAPFLTLDNGQRHRFAQLAPAIGALIYSAVTTERFAIILVAALTAAATIAAKTLAGGDAPVITRRGMIVSVVMALTLAGVFAGIAFVRVGSTDPGYHRIVRDRMAFYAFAYEPAYSAWLASSEASSESEPLRLGSTTFAPVGILLGGITRDEQRRYSEFAMVTDEGAKTNVFTAFRGVLRDFGRPGAVLFMMVFGMATGTAYRRVVTAASPVAAVGLAASYAAILLSMVHSIYTFSNVCGALALAALIMHRASVRQPGAGHDPVVAGLEDPPVLQMTDGAFDGGRSRLTL